MMAQVIVTVDILAFIWKTGEYDQTIGIEKIITPVSKYLCYTLSPRPLTFAFFLYFVDYLNLEDWLLI